MSFQMMNDDVEIISKLGDEPNEDDGLDAAGLKAKFDEAATLLKAAHNALVGALNAANAAESVGFGSDDIDGENVKDAMENLRTYLLEQMQDVSQGSVADGSITTDKLHGDAVTGAKIAAGTMRQDITGANVMTVRRSEFSSVTNGLKLHYFRPLGMVFIEGVVTVVPTAERQSATIDFDSYAPIPMDNDVYDICTDDATYRQASIVTGSNSTSLVVTLKNISQSSFGSSLKIKIAGWYFCDGEGS